MIPRLRRRTIWCERDAMYGPHAERHRWIEWRGRRYRWRATILPGPRRYR